MKDEKLAKKVNLTPQTNSDNVQDIYSEIGVEINKAINNYGILNQEFSSLAEVKLTRDFLKLSIMTKVYNVTKYGISLQLKNKLKTIDSDSDNYSGAGQEGFKFINKSSDENFVNNKILLKNTWRTGNIGESGEFCKTEYTECLTQDYKEEGETKKKQKRGKQSAERG